jgi:integrase
MVEGLDMKTVKRKKRQRGVKGGGSIVQLPSGKYRVLISSIDPLTKKRVRLTRTFDTMEEAVSFRNEMSGKQKRQRAGKKTVGEWLDEWLQLKEGKIANGSWKWYEQKVRLYIKPTIGAGLLSELDSLLCERLLVELQAKGVSAYGQRAARTTLRAALSRAVKHNLVDTNPVKETEPPKKTHRESQWWTAEEARAFLVHPAVAGHRLHALFRLALDAGLRQGELFALKWPDIHWDSATIHVQRSLEEVDSEYAIKETKTKKGNRKVVVGTPTLTALRQHKEAMEEEKRDVKNGTVFLNTDGGWLGKSDFYKTFHRLIARVGLKKIRPYDLRHSCASMLLGAGASIRAIADQLGHEDVTVTLKHYAKCLPSDQGPLAKLSAELLQPKPNTDTH